MHTHTTTRTYVRPDGTHVDVVDPALPPAPVSVIPPTALGDSGTMPGHQLSDHQHVTMGNAAPLPHTHSIHEDLVQHPNIQPVDTSHHSVSEVRGPALTPGTAMPNVVAGPAGTMPPPGTNAAIPVAPGTAAPAAAPATLANAATARPPASVWDTNHPAHAPPPATTLGNMPTANGGGAPSVVAGHGAAPAPAAMENIALEPLPPAGSGPIPANISTGAPAHGTPSAAVVAPPPASSGKGGRKGLGVRWDSHLPGKDVVGVPGRTPPSQ